MSNACVSLQASKGTVLPAKHEGIKKSIRSKKAFANLEEDRVGFSDAPGEGKRRFPKPKEESRQAQTGPRKYKYPHNEGCAIMYSFDLDAFGNYKEVEVCEEDWILASDAPGEGKKRTSVYVKREDDRGWDKEKHGLMFGFVEERRREGC
jgi:hypothetical protein